jgi:hypothetical protein
MRRDARHNWSLCFSPPARLAARNSPGFSADLHRSLYIVFGNGFDTR